MLLAVILLQYNAIRKYRSIEGLENWRVLDVEYWIGEDQARYTAVLATQQVWEVNQGFWVTIKRKAEDDKVRQITITDVVVAEASKIRWDSTTRTLNVLPSSSSQPVTTVSVDTDGGN